jgi:hypothetical protein
LKGTISEKEVKIRTLELEIEKLKNALAEANLAKKVASTASPTAAEEEDVTASATVGAASAAAEEENTEEGVVSPNSISGNADDVELPHNSNSLTE